ncbi:MAG: hypothetical protein COB50_04065 [Thiotrichales bacterium]|nr:MAG: hypothetical protein COB50_04065 [Thiotrichales bacterium]
MTVDRQNKKEYKKHKYSNNRVFLDTAKNKATSIEFKKQLSPQKLKLAEEKQQIIADEQLAKKLQIKGLKIKINEEYDDKANEEKNNYRIEKTNSQRQVTFTAYYTGEEPIDKILGRVIVEKDNGCAGRRNIYGEEVADICRKHFGPCVVAIIPGILGPLIGIFIGLSINDEDTAKWILLTIAGTIFCSVICALCAPCRSSERYEYVSNAELNALQGLAQSEITKRINLLKSKQQETTLIIFNQSRRDSSSEIHIEIKENALVEGNQSSDNSHKSNSEAELNASINKSYDDSSDTEVEELEL